VHCEWICLTTWWVIKVQLHKLSCDVLVAGGGPAGFTAAIAAARRGAKVVLCHDRPVLGGNASSEVRMHIVGADQSGKRGKELETEAREGGIIEEIRLENCVRNPQRSSSMFDLILYEKSRAEPNLTLLLNTTVIAAEVEHQQIRRAIAERQSTEDRFTIEAAVYIDATGDGRLGVEAGASFMEGRESREQFGESIAEPVADNKRLGSSLLFQARNHGRPMPYQAPAWARKFTETDLKFRPHGISEGFGDLGLEYGYWWVEWGGHLDTIKDNEAIRDELMAILLGVWDHVKNGGDHGAENWALEWCGFVPGKRESRRFIGQHVLTESDVRKSVPFDDAIAYGGWFIDTHPPEGVDAPDEDPCAHHDVPHLYDIPLRACVSNSVQNLMFAGRNISATHIAFASTRVMATCSVVGQGVGTAAAYAAQHKLLPSNLSETATAIHDIQQQLIEDDAFLIGRVHTNPCDFAKQARVTASSEQPQGPAKNVTVGPTRSVHGPAGVARERAIAGTHRWMSDPAAGLPAWIQLDWSKPIAPKRLQMIFDTGMHRVLTFSLADSYTQKMHWGRPQPETVREYKVEAKRRGLWELVEAVAGNYQRRNVVDLPGTEVEALRVTVMATNGLDHARILSIQVC
jgi:hypothetical protein